MINESIETLDERLDQYFGHDDLKRAIWRISGLMTKLRKLKLIIVLKVLNYLIKSLEK